jgi:yersiniabactin salicyl-AMP ligase
MEQAKSNARQETRDEFVWFPQHITLADSPLAVAASLIGNFPESQLALYEQNGVFRLYIGCMARIQLQNRQLKVNFDGLCNIWPIEDAGQLPVILEQALATLPLQQWIGWGTVDFEYARAIYHLPVDRNTRLIDMIIPQSELRIIPSEQGDGSQVYIRTFEESEISAFIRLLNTVKPMEPDVRAGVRVPFETENGMVYQKIVRQAVDEIHQGYYQKVILSRRVQVEQPLDIAASYFVGRQNNTPARSFLIQKDELNAAGFCPEMVVEVSADRQVKTQPLAGTRARGASEQINQSLKQELLNDTKEIAEHAISVKLALEEVGPISEPNSVRVSEFMQVYQRGTVQHLGSRVKSCLKAHCSRWHALNALFPAVTASGIPKKESIDAIGRFESQPRGLYSGSVFIADSNGMLDAALVLRTFYRQGEQQWLQAGAGLVSLSSPERELEETREKMASVATYLIGKSI